MPRRMATPAQSRSPAAPETWLYHLHGDVVGQTVALGQVDHHRDLGGFVVAPLGITAPGSAFIRTQSWQSPARCRNPGKGGACPVREISSPCAFQEHYRPARLLIVVGVCGPAGGWTAVVRSRPAHRPAHAGDSKVSAATPARCPSVVHIGLRAPGLVAPDDEASLRPAPARPTSRPADSARKRAVA